MALSASTWMGKATPSVVLGAVSLLPSEPSAATCRSARNDAVVGCSPAFAVRVSHGSTLGQAARVARAHEQDVASPDLHSLLALRRLEVFHEDVLARLEPSHAANARHVEQHAAARPARL